jgi:hypothetical protein
MADFYLNLSQKIKIKIKIKSSFIDLISGPIGKKIQKLKTIK